MRILSALLFLLLAPALAAQTVNLVDLQQPDAGPVPPGTQNHEVLQFRLYRGSGSSASDLTELKVTLNGTAASGDWDAVDLYYNADGSREIDAGDVLLDTATTSSAGKVTFTGLNEPVQEGFQFGRDYLVAVDVAAGAVLDNTFEFSVEEADVTVSSGTVSAPFGTITSNVHTIRVDSGAEMDVSRGGTPIPSSTTSQHDVGYVDEGTGASFTFTIDNTGTGTLELTGNPIVAVSNETQCSVNVLSPPATTIPGPGSDDFTIDVAPALAADFSFRMTIENNDFDEFPYIINIVGTAIPQPEIEIEYNSSIVNDGGDIDIGSHPAAVPSTLDFTIYNTGNADLELPGTPIVGFAGQQNLSAALQTAPSTPVGQGSSTIFTVEFTPTGSGAFTFVVWVESNDADETFYNINVEGTAPGVTPVKLDVFREPGDADATVPFGTQPVIAVAASNGAVDTSDNSTMVEVTLNAGNGAVLSGTTTLTASGGYASFTDLRIDKEGTGYTLTFADVGGTLTSVTSQPFDVGPEPVDSGEDDESSDDSGGGCSTGATGTPWMMAWMALAGLVLAARSFTPHRADA